MGFNEIVRIASESDDTKQARLKTALNKIAKDRLKNIFTRVFEPGVISSFSNVSDGPLRNLIFCVKDNICVKGFPVSLGLKPVAKDEVSDHAAVVDFFLSRGATLVGASNLDPLCLTSEGFNPYYGDVENPAFPKLITAGSSSGSAAAVAGKYVDFSIGTDFGGSVRAPAAACGVYGACLSPGLISGQGIVNWLAGLDLIGVFTEHLEDLHYLIESSFLPQTLTEQNEFRIIIPDDSELGILEREEFKAFKHVLSKLENSGIALEVSRELNFDQIKTLKKDLTAIKFEEEIRKLGIDFSALPDAGKAMLLYAESLQAVDRNRAQAEKHSLTEQITRLLQDGTYILTPTLPVRPQERCSSAEGNWVLLNHFLGLANLTQCPAISMPLDIFDRVRSLHIIGAPYSDNYLINLAFMLREVL